MWDLEAYLITDTGEFERDKIGNKVPIYRKDAILAKDMPTSRNEFYLAGQNNIAIAKTIIVHSFEYDEQKQVEINGETYSVIKTYPISFDEIELTLRAKAGR